LRSLDNSLKLVQLFNVRDPKEVITNLDWISTYGYGIGVNEPIINDPFVKLIKSKHLELHIWTVDKEEEMKNLIDLGVTGIFTDYPNILQKVLIQKGMR
jgi:glycerophosphoryl diester phosphodiesterase